MWWPTIRWTSQRQLSDSQALRDIEVSRGGCFQHECHYKRGHYGCHSCCLYRLLQSQKNVSLDTGSGEVGLGDGLEVVEVAKKMWDAPIEQFTVTCDKHTQTWQVDRAGLHCFRQMTIWEYFEAVCRFQHVLKVTAVNQALLEQGVGEGDTVVVAQKNSTGRTLMILQI